MYSIGNRYRWIPINHQDKVIEVEVKELRRGGKAILSNGWCVDEEGYAEGTKWMPGGRIEPLTDAR